MGREQPAQGDAAECCAFGWLLDSFQDVAKLQSGAAIDLKCFGLLAERESTKPYSDPRLAFNFQIKSAGYERPDIGPIRHATLRKWIELSESEPVVILGVARVQDNRRVRWMLTLHNWMIETASEHHRDDWRIRSEHYERIDNADSFQAAMQREADRALRERGSPLGTMRDYGLLPVDEATLLEFMELARFLEVPTAVFRVLSRDRVRISRQFRAYLQGDETPADPIVREWIEAIWALRLPTLETSFERKQFGHFVSVMRRPNQPVRMPKFRGAEVGCWRTFVAMYPESVKVMASVAALSPYENDVMFASAMLPTLALSSDRYIQFEAKRALSELRTRDHFSSYALLRELVRAPVEGKEGNIEDLLQFVRTGLATGEERRFLSSYGWTTEALWNNVERKLTRPTLRDESLAPLYELMADKLL